MLSFLGLSSGPVYERVPTDDCSTIMPSHANKPRTWTSYVW